MKDPRTIKAKMLSVGRLKKTTKAMEMVARGKMKRAVANALSTRPYASCALELLLNLSKELSEEKLKEKYLFPAEEAEKNLIVLIAANRGLCGGYNAMLLKGLKNYLSGEAETEKTEFLCVGKYAAKHVRRIGGTILKIFDNISEDPQERESGELADYLLGRHKTGEYRGVAVIYSNFISVFKQETVVRKLLPLSAISLASMIKELGEDVPDPEEIRVERISQNNYLFEPAEESVIEVVVPRLLKAQVYQSLLEANASEQSARMVAMKNATENADKMGKELLLNYNKARQAAITKEILEVAAAISP